MNMKPISPLNTDRWTEIDLYWFDRNDLQGSADEFWERFAPLYKGLNGWIGVILNVGWTVDYIMDWKNDFNQPLVFPPSEPQNWFTVTGPLAGTTEERMEKWKRRFSAASPECKKKVYQPWTYGDIQKLAKVLKQTAATKYGYQEILVGSFAYARSSAYGDISSWVKKHLDAFKDNVLNMACLMPADSTAYGGFPEGISQDTPVYEVFGKQWGSLSQALGLDAIVLRDWTLHRAVYGRGETIDSPDVSRSIHNALCNLVRVTKQSNPQALVMGYSNAASAISDWRCNGLDLEALAKEGYLDAWIDQTWAGAWNEVGVRESNFWNHWQLGWTYQMATMLLHAAILADTKVRHYPLIETFDAWEDWDIIHTAPDRLRWAIWAYSHAAVKTPQGIKMPAGSYISWANQGKRLISDADVRFLSETINESVADALEVKEVHGPTMVYHRDAMEWVMSHLPAPDINEWMDEQVGTIIKWPAPIMSATRMEWLSDVKSDLWIVQSPVHLSPENLERLSSIIQSGKPILLLGNPRDGMDPEIAKLVGIFTAAAPSRLDVMSGETAVSLKEITEGIPATFPLRQLWHESSHSSGLLSIYSADQSPLLAINREGGKRLAFWDAPDFPWGPPWTQPSKCIGDDLRSPYPYVLTARVMNQLLAETDAISANEIDPEQTVCVMAWELKNGKQRILVANTEEGWRHDADHSRYTTLLLPRRLFSDSSKMSYFNLWDSKVTGLIADQALPIHLGQAESQLFEL